MAFFCECKSFALMGSLNYIAFNCIGGLCMNIRHNLLVAALFSFVAVADEGDAKHHNLGKKTGFANLKKTAVAYSALRTVKQEFSQINESNEIVGFSAELDGQGQIEAAVYKVSGKDLAQKNNFDCRPTLDKDGMVRGVRCRKAASSDAFEYEPAQGSFSQKEYEDIVLASLDTLSKVKDIAGNPVDLRTISKAKYWRSFAANEPNVQVKFVWGAGFTTFMMCHLHHGKHMDCHRQRAAGEHEPQD
jgi:hypothetical protein